MLDSDETILLFNQTLQESKFEAYFWEVKPIQKQGLDQDFEFVLVNSESLKIVSANDSAFKQYFKENELVVNFPNLNGDANLIVPTPISKNTDYAHLATFVRTADDKQVLAFWKTVLMNYQQNIGGQTKWLSTSGLGVHWLHARIDSVPKYYQHLEYKH